MQQAPEELAAFCAAEYGRLVGALALYCGDRTLAEDLAQETLLRVCRDWPRVQRMAAPGAWTHRVAMNLAASHFRTRAAQRRRQRRLEQAATLASPQPDSGEMLVLREAVAALPRRQRAAVVLHYYLGHPVTETALLMRVPVGTAKSLLSRARARLVLLLDEQEAFDG